MSPRSAGRNACDSSRRFRVIFQSGDSAATHRQMLEQPRSQDICCNLWENSSFLLVLFAVGVVVLLAGALPAAYTSVTRVT